MKVEQILRSDAISTNHQRASGDDLLKKKNLLENEVIVAPAVIT